MSKCVLNIYLPFDLLINMPKSMLGCHLACSRSQIGQINVLEAPIFTAGKLNVNGEGIPDSEVQTVSAQLIGAPIRYCPNGISIGGVPKEHACGLHEDEASIVGYVDAVTMKKDSEGRNILYPRATIKEGVSIDALPSGWSLLADYNAKDENGFVYGLQNPRIDLTDTPAYDEARFKLYPQFAASIKSETDSNINTNSEDNTLKAGINMPIDNNTDITKGQTPAPIEKVEVPTPTAAPAVKETLTKDEVTAMFAEMSKKFEDEKAKLKEETITATKDNIERERRVMELIANGEKLGIVTPENKEAKTQRYMSLPKEAFNDVYEDFNAVNGKYIEATKVSRQVSRSFNDVNLHAPTPAADKERVEGVKNILTKFGYSPEEAQKAYENAQKYM